MSTVGAGAWVAGREPLPIRLKPRNPPVAQPGRFDYGSLYTSFRYTGQRQEASLGIYFYTARWYDPALGRFLQADPLVPHPGEPQAWDRNRFTP